MYFAVVLLLLQACATLDGQGPLVYGFGLNLLPYSTPSPALPSYPLQRTVLYADLHRAIVCGRSLIGCCKVVRRHEAFYMLNRKIADLHALYVLGLSITAFHMLMWTHANCKSYCWETTCFATVAGRNLPYALFKLIGKKGNASGACQHYYDCHPKGGTRQGCKRNRLRQTAGQHGLPANNK
jgi:hypothetical protein